MSVDDHRGLPRPKGEVVCAFGDVVLDLVAVLDGPLPIGGQVHGTVQTRPGGCARNVAVVASNCKVPARFVGRCGDGPSADVLRRSLSDAGVDIRSVDAGRYSTYLCLQLVSGEITYVTDAPDVDCLTADDVTEEWFEDAAVVHVTGHDIFIERRLPVFEKVARLARDAGAQLSIDIALGNELDNFGLERFFALVEEWRPLVVFCSEQEGDLLELDRRYPTGAGAVVQHRAVASTRVFLPDGGRIDVPVRDAHRFADTVGAGDAFAGGFLSAWLRTDSMREACESAHSAAVHFLRGLDHPAGGH